MITKREIDNYFNTNYDSILLYIDKTFSKYKHNMYNENTEFFLSELYLYVEKRKEDIQDESMLKKYISTFINNNCYWTNSNVRESLQLQKQNKTIEFDVGFHDEEEWEVEEELDIINEYKAVVEMYYKELRSVDKKVVWEIYFIEGKQTIKSFAEYINMSRTVANKLIKELKKDILNYYEEYKLKYKD